MMIWFNNNNDDDNNNYEPKLLRKKKPKVQTKKWKSWKQKEKNKIFKFFSYPKGEEKLLIPAEVFLLLQRGYRTSVRDPTCSNSAGAPQLPCRRCLWWAPHHSLGDSHIRHQLLIWRLFSHYSWWRVKVGNRSLRKHGETMRWRSSSWWKLSVPVPPLLILKLKLTKKVKYGNKIIGTYQTTRSRL